MQNTDHKRNTDKITDIDKMSEKEKKIFMRKRIGMMLVGVFLMGVSIAFYRKVQFGTDPYTGFVLGVTDKIGLTLGVTQLIINSFIIAFGFFFGRRFIGIGTIANMVLVGFIADGITLVYEANFPDPEILWVRIIIFTMIVVLHSFGGSIFFTAALGVGPYDILGFLINFKTKINYRWCRIATDVICVIAGFLLGSVIGVGTVVTALFMGPIIQFFTEKFSVPFLNK